MARHLRSEYQGAIDHVTSRGNGRNIFLVYYVDPEIYLKGQCGFYGLADFSMAGVCVGYNSSVSTFCCYLTEVAASASSRRTELVGGNRGV